MTKLHYDGQEYALQESETALECLLRNKIDYPHSCKLGTCQSCLSQMKSGTIQKNWQIGLKSTHIEQNYFLPCICKPEIDISFELPNAKDIAIKSEIIDMFLFNHNVLCVRISYAEEQCSWKAGQYINLIASSQLIRSYSIANIPSQDGYIELHIKLTANGTMSTWLMETAKIGTSVFLQGPMGNCFYCNPKQESFTIVMAGTGTGLAPLFGIALDALQQKHPGNIVLIHGGVTKKDLYLNEQLELLSQNHKNFVYKKCTLDENDPSSNATIEQLLLQTLKDIAQKTRVFVCGPEKITKTLKMKAFLAGVPSCSIFSDTFI